ncbi:MAG: hypothetical protein R3F46_00900 [bacterium]
MGHTFIRPVAAGFVITLALLCGLLQLQAVAAPEESPPDSRWFSQRTEDSGYVRTIVNAIQPLDAPGNPYSGMYSDWDRWAMQNFQSGITISEISEMFQYPYDPQPDANGMVRQWMDMRVDRDGFLVPWTHFLEGWGNPELPYGNSGQMGESLAVALAVGMIDSDLHADWKSAIESARSLSRAKTSAPIPAWIGEQPPLELIGLPNGEFAIRGPLGLDLDDRENDEIANIEFREHWYRYSADGKLIAMDNAGEPGPNFQHWMALFLPGLDELVEEQRAQGLQPMYGIGIIGFYEPEEPKEQTYDELSLRWDPGTHFQKSYDFRSAYDYLGNEVDATEHVSRFGTISRLPGVWSMRYKEIGPTYQAQLDMGLTTRSSVSPYAGSPQGPRIAGPDYRLPVYARIARRTTDDMPASVELRPLDDPANPWRGQYSRFDIMNYDASQQGNLAMSRLFREKDAANRELIEEAKEQGQTIEQFREAHPDFNTGVSSERLREAGIVDMYNYVSPEGWMVPLAISSAWPRDMEMDSGRYTYSPEVQELMSYRLSNDVQLSDTELLEFEEWQTTLRTLYRIVNPGPEPGTAVNQ